MTQSRFLISIVATLTLMSLPLAAQQDRATEKKALIELGLQYGSAEALYLALREQAGGGQRLTWDKFPDWTGMYSRDMSKGILYDQEQTGLMPPAKLTPEFHEKLIRKINNALIEIEYDPISGCTPPGHPRWLTSPFLREQIITPNQVYLMSEVTNSTRRVYTDGRGHPPPEERYPLYNGDSIGFWDGDHLGCTHKPIDVGTIHPVAAGLHRGGRDRRNMAQAQ